MSRIPKISAEVAARAWSFVVLVNGRPAKTPRGNELVLPSAALARAVAAEIEAMPATLAGKGLNDPSAAPNLRIAAGAIDVVAEADGRAAVAGELLGYIETDLVLIRATEPAALVAREDALWGPLCAWFADRFGVMLTCGRGVLAARQTPEVEDVVRRALDGIEPFGLAALSLAVRASGSLVIGFALCSGRIDADAAYAASVLEEKFQEEKWGADREAEKARAVRHLDLAQAERFLGLLTEK